MSIGNVIKIYLFFSSSFFGKSMHIHCFFYRYVQFFLLFHSILLFQVLDLLKIVQSGLPYTSMDVEANVDMLKAWSYIVEVDSYLPLSFKC